MSHISIIEGLSQGVWPNSAPLELPEHRHEQQSIMPSGWIEQDFDQFAHMNPYGLYVMTDLDRGDGTRLACVVIL
jgi:hypothetical protein